MPTRSSNIFGNRSATPTFLQFTDQSVVFFGARVFAECRGKHDPTISSFSRSYGFGISWTIVDAAPVRQFTAEERAQWEKERLGREKKAG
jgi:hypothetical protein